MARTSPEELVRELKRFVREHEKMSAYGGDSFEFSTISGRKLVTIDANFDSHSDDFNAFRNFALIYDYVPVESRNEYVVLQPNSKATRKARRRYGDK